MSNKLKIRKRPPLAMKKIFSDAGVSQRLLGIYAGISQASVALYLNNYIDIPEASQILLTNLAELVATQRELAEKLLQDALDNYK